MLPCENLSWDVENDELVNLAHLVSNLTSSWRVVIRVFGEVC
jgi:hypothetical protein